MRGSLPQPPARNTRDFHGSDYARPLERAAIPVERAAPGDIVPLTKAA